MIGVVNPEAPTLVFPGSFGTIVITDPVAAAMDARADAEFSSVVNSAMVVENDSKGRITCTDPNPGTGNACPVALP